MVRYVKVEIQKYKILKKNDEKFSLFFFDK